MKFRSVLDELKISVSAILVLAFCLELLGASFFNLLLFSPKIADAAQTTIESSPDTTGSVHTLAGSALVFVNDQTGYKFFRYGASPDTGECVYRKTTNGGATWGNYVVIDNQSDCIAISVWYDRWTPGDNGNYIHIATMDTGDDDLFYNRLDTSNDTLLLTTSVNISPSAAAVLAATTNRLSVTKGTDGKIYMNVDDGNGTILRQCNSGCQTPANWSDAGTPPQGSNNTWSILVPLLSGNIMLINRSTTNVLRSSIWNGSSWSSMTTIDSSAPYNTTYDVGMAATINTTNGKVYLSYMADNDTFNSNQRDHDLRTAVYSGGVWTRKTDIITNDPNRGLLQTAIAFDQNTEDIYIGYTARATINSGTSANVFWATSSDEMTTWGSQQGPLNSVQGDFYGIDMNIMSFERIYITWYDNNGTQRIYGDTVADISPEVILSSVGNQFTEVRGGANDFYIGGKFALKSLSSRTVSNVVVRESGTIDADDNVKNVKLFYETDTSDPYDCSSESYSGGEVQFGSTLAGGFSGDNGSASFTATPVSITPTQSLCFYVVLDVEETASDGDTIEISVNNPKTDVIVSGGVDVYPYDSVEIASTTTVVSPNITQNAYHWRNDDGNETGATSATRGVENTPLSAIQANDIYRLRLGVANQGSTSTDPSTYRLEYGTASPTCSDTSDWSPLGNNEKFMLYDSANLTNGNDTTDISTSTGGVSNGGSSFITNNDAIRDTSNDTGTLTLNVNEFFEAEYSIIASSTVTEGETYCFRMTASGSTFSNYTNYPRVTISADVTVSSFDSQVSTLNIPSTANYSGGGFVITENSSSRNVTGITIYEQGTVDGSANIKNLALYYDKDISTPFNCVGESFDGNETQFGATSTDGFSDSGEKKSFTDSVLLTSTSSLCVYVVFDVGNQSQNGETVELAIYSPTSDVVVNGGGTVGPSFELNIASSTTLQGGVLNQTNFHWRNDDGNETGATSATGGSEDVVLLDFAQNSSIRLRFGITNNGLVSTVPSRFTLEYSPKITTCSAATIWTDIGLSGDGWEMKDSIHLTNGETTTNINEIDGGVTDGNNDFITDNGGVRDTESSTATTTLSSTEHLDVEYSIKSNNLAAYNTTYCFRVTANGTAFQTYSNYAEVTTSPKRDFLIQRGSSLVSGTSSVLLAGTDYDTPASSTRAFVRITNSHHTGAGNDNGAGSAQNSDDITAYIEDSNDLTNSFTISRPTSAINETYVDWEIVEFIGSPGTDNEMIIRDIGTLQFGSSDLIATGTAVSNVGSDSQIVVFMTGASNQNVSRNLYASQVTSDWDSVTQRPVFTRAADGSSVVDISYAVVEFIGVNWNIQRVEHQYSSSNVVETESITAVNNLSRTFIHAQKRVGASVNVVDFGHQVWLSSIGAISFLLHSESQMAVEHTAVVWVIENNQTGNGQMKVQRSNGLTVNGSSPLALSVVLTTPVSATNNTSIMANTNSDGQNTNYPRPMAGFTITSTTTYQIWRSNTSSNLTYRTEIIEWPVADLALRQNYYRFYVHNNALKPTDPWPEGASDLGENTSITTSDQPLGLGDKLRIRMNVKVSNANMPTAFQNFYLQYGLRSSTCSAIEVNNWFTVGEIGSSTPWRGYSATGTTDGTYLSADPPTVGDLVLSVSDRAGVLIHENPSIANPYPVLETENVEYDWHLENNGANSRSTYCFRMIRSDGSSLDSYNFYPQIRTAEYTPVTQNWRWYEDVENETPTLPLATENVAPIDVGIDDTLALRISVAESKNVQGENIKFKLQYSEDSSFSSAFDVVATSSCLANSIWCYVEGGGSDNGLISTKLLSDSDSCVSEVGDGCGTHNSSPVNSTGHVQKASSVQEFSFTLKQAGARVNAVYYFRLYDLDADIPVLVGDGEAIPSLVTEGASLNFSVSGLPIGTTTASVSTNISTNPSNINFGNLVIDTEYIGAHRISVDTNSTEGYQVLGFARQQLLNSYGIEIPSIPKTNSSPDSWISSCSATSTGCVGYHTTDATLSGASTRFAADDTYAGLETSPVELMHSSVPTIDSHDIVYRIKVDELQEAGDYETEMVYLAVPSF